MQQIFWLIKMYKLSWRRKYSQRVAIQRGTQQVYDTVASVARQDITLIHARRIWKWMMNWILSSFDRLFSL